MCIRFLMALSCIFWVQAATADVVEPPPENCPEGSVGEMSHAGPYCRPDDCSDDPNRCSGEKSCIKTELCIVKVDGYSNGGPFTVDHVTGFCTAGGNCEGTCTTLPVCMSPSDTASAPEPSPKKSGGCSFVPYRGSTPTAVAAIVAVLVGILLLSRRRRVDGR